jgi:glycosyltransferase involved in cell wall biosynthesis
MILEKISVLILAHNEEKTIEEDIYNLYNALNKRFKNFQIIISEDGSRDNTYKKILFLKRKFNLILSTSRKRKGYAKAFINGINKCQSNVIFFSDTGKKYDYNNFFYFFKIFKKNNADLCCGIRIGRKDKLIRRALTFFYSIFLKLLFLRQFSDFDCGFRIYNKKKLKCVINKHSFHPMLIGSQIFMLFIKYKFKIIQKELKYLENNKRNSRGIPATKIISTIFSSIFFSIKIRFLNV